MPDVGLQKTGKTSGARDSRGRFRTGPSPPLTEVTRQAAIDRYINHVELMMFISPVSLPLLLRLRAGAPGGLTTHRGR